MSDFLVVVITMGALGYLAWFIYNNDGDDNARPDKTLMAMAEDKAPTPRRRFGMPAHRQDAKNGRRPPR